VTAAFCRSKLSILPDLLTTVADDWLGRMFLELAAKYKTAIHCRNVGTSSLSFIMPKEPAEAARKPLSKLDDHSLAARADRTVEGLS
jgi:hypothetical protein